MIMMLSTRGNQGVGYPREYKTMMRRQAGVNEPLENDSIARHSRK